MVSPRILVVSLLLVLSACTGSPQRPPRDLAGAPVTQQLPVAERARITDGNVRSDFNYIESLQARIHALNERGVPASGYALAKAQCWLEWSLDEYHDQDRTGVIEESAGESLKLIEALEAGREIDPATRIVATSTRVREDLWQRAVAARTDERFAAPRACGNATAACLEVKLVEAGHDYRETGWRHARPAIIEAEQMAAQLRRELTACPALALPPAPVAPVPVVAADGDVDGDSIPDSRDRCPNTAPPMRVDANGCEIKQEIRLPGVNFASDSPQLLTGSQAVLDDAAATLRRYPDLRVEIAGHTDSSGAAAYNQGLSARRAQTVLDYFKAAGVTNTLTARGYGEDQPLADNATADGRAQNRRVLLRLMP
jgi:outer membrane protein OmpA-like peptidoglycan-associated protein